MHHRQHIISHIHKSTCVNENKNQMQEARAALRGRAAGATILLRGGDYVLHEPFVLSAVDSGTPGHPVTYASFPGERAQLIGGVEILSDAFRPSKMYAHFNPNLKP